MSDENHATPQNSVIAARRFSQEINRVINEFSQELAPHELVGLIQLQQDSLVTHILNIVRVAEVTENIVVPENAADADGFGTPIVPEEAIPRPQPET